MTQSITTFYRLESESCCDTRRSSSEAKFMCQYYCDITENFIIYQQNSIELAQVETIFILILRLNYT